MSGHDFSRAADAAKWMRALAPAGWLYSNRPNAAVGFSARVVLPFDYGVSAPGLALRRGVKRVTACKAWPRNDIGDSGSKQKNAPTAAGIVVVYAHGSVVWAGLGICCGLRA